MKNHLLALYIMPICLISQTNTFPATGSVGIGTTNPIHGSLHINANGPGGGLNLWTESGELTSRIWIDNQAQTFHLSKGENPEAGITINNNGWAGIGTIAPQGQLHVSSRDYGDAILFLEADRDNNNEADNPIIQMRQDGGIIGTNIGFSEHFGENRFGIGTRYRTERADKWDTFVIDIATNNIGIGTKDPGAYKLAVNGNIRAKEIKVETGWADHVFEKGYDLPTLEEVADHIREKGHLINIPSAAEVEENGIELGEMNRLLLEKIEELMLYVLDQDSKIRFLEEKILTNECSNKDRYYGKDQK
ncbi:MAG: hypothetical protein V7724_10895 [Sediminicola sp.]